MHPIEVFGYQTAFVGLQWADEMPLDTRARFAKGFYLGNPLLNVVFTKAVLPGGKGCLNIGHRFGFTDREEFDF